MAGQLCLCTFSRLICSLNPVVSLSQWATEDAPLPLRHVVAPGIPISASGVIATNAAAAAAAASRAGGNSPPNGAVPSGAAEAAAVAAAAAPAAPSASPLRLLSMLCGLSRPASLMAVMPQPLARLNVRRLAMQTGEKGGKREKRKEGESRRGEKGRAGKFCNACA
eukprot:350110-Chlamydomonas_euryale.AAC.2